MIQSFTKLCLYIITHLYGSIYRIGSIRIPISPNACILSVGYEGERKLEAYGFE